MLLFKGHISVLLQCLVCFTIYKFSHGLCTRNNTSNISIVGRDRNTVNHYDNKINDTDHIGHHVGHHRHSDTRNDRGAKHGIDTRNGSGAKHGSDDSVKERQHKLNSMKLDYDTVGVTRVTTKNSKISKRWTTPPALLYFGGAVIPNVQVYTVFYGNVTYKDEINRFYNDVVNSSFIDWLSEYNTPSESIGRGSFIGSYTYTYANKIKSSIDDTADITTFLFDLIQSGTIHPNKNTLYTIHLAPKVSVTKQKSKSCVDFCAYHATLDISKIYKNFPYLYYTVVPDLSGACKGLCGSSLSVFDNTCSIASHELIEAITDPGVGLGKLAWYDPSNGEISDICNMQQSSLIINSATKYTVQKQWSNSQKNCIIDMVSTVPVIPAQPVQTSSQATGATVKVTKVTKIVTKTVYVSPVTKTVTVTKTKSNSIHKCTKHTTRKHD